jgi:hypothetical protein
VHQEEGCGHYHSGDVNRTFRQGSSLGAYDQRLTRVHRPGQKRAVTSGHLALKGTVERHMLKAREERKEVMRVGPERAGKDRKPMTMDRPTLREMHRACHGMSLPAPLIKHDADPGSGGQTGPTPTLLGKSNTRGKAALPPTVASQTPHRHASGARAPRRRGIPAAWEASGHRSPAYVEA